MKRLQHVIRKNEDDTTSKLQFLKLCNYYQLTLLSQPKQLQSEIKSLGMLKGKGYFKKDEKIFFHMETKGHVTTGKNMFSVSLLQLYT